MLLTQYQAAQLPGAPDRTALYKLVNSDNPPNFVMAIEGKIKINTEDSSWIDLVNANKYTAAKKDKDINLSPVMLEFELRAQRAKCEAPILKNKALRMKLKAQELDLKIQRGELITFKTAEFLFFAYMEAINVELLSLTKKIKPVIENFCKEKNYDGLISFLANEHSVVLKTVKDSQAKEIIAWKKEL